MKLTANSVKAANKAGRYSDGQGLYLNVTPSGAKSWIFMWKRDGRQREMGLGSATGAGKVAVVSLALAREKAAECRRVLAGGGDPIDERRRQKSISFGDAADQLIASLEAGWKNEKHRAQWRMTMDEYAKPLRSKSVRDIDTDDILSVLKPIWLQKPETASRVRGRIEKVLDWSRAKGFRTDENPARWRGHLATLLSAPSKLGRGHHAAMAYRDVPAFAARLAEENGRGARALELTILTAGRTGEILGARVDEFDLVSRVWVVPAARMKAGKEHAVPLSDRAVSVVKPLIEEAVDGLLFPGLKRGSHLSNMAMLAVLKRMNVDCTVHGFRSSFRDWIGNQTSFPRELAEEALAHVIASKVEKAYRREQAIERRRKMMEAWAAYLYAQSNGKIVEMAGIIRRNGSKSAIS